MVHAYSLRSINRAREALEAEFDWFDKLPPHEQFKIAVRFSLHQRIFIHFLRFLNDLIPWAIALIVLVKS